MRNLTISNGVKYILGKKIGMSQMFDKNGKLTPVTLILAGPCYVLSRWQSHRGSSTAKQSGQNYDATQIGFEKITKMSKLKKSLKARPYKYVKEFRGQEATNVGEEINVSVFLEGENVKVSGYSKGKGFQGGVKRHGFSGRNATHGVKHEHRTIGSTGSRFPQHVMKGRKMPGRMGFERVSVKNLKIMKVDKENNLLVLKGAVPGRTGALLEIKA